MLHHHHILHYFRHRELNALYASIAIRTFAFSMIAIFVPIYLLQSGLSITQVLIFFSVFSFTHAIASFPAAKIAAKRGFKHSILYSIPFLIVALLMLYTLELYNWPIYLIAVIFGFNNAFFWIGFHTDFAKFSDKKKRGAQVGTARIVTSIFNVLGPLIGGLILTFIGFKVLFILVSILLFSATIPLFKSKDLYSPAKFTLKGTFKGRKIRDSIGFVGFGFERVMAGVIWPIFIFFTIFGEKFISLGLVTSLTLFSSLIFVFVVGKFSDTKRRAVLRTGAIGSAIVWFFKTAVVTPIQVFLIDIFYGATNTMSGIAFQALSYDKANKHVISRYILYREFMINIARGLMFLIMIFVVDLASGFIFGGSLGSLLKLVF